jgi:hypothetical protein
MDNPETHTTSNTQDTVSLLVSSSVISNVYLLSLYCVLCIRCCMCLWIVHYWFPLRLFLTFTYYLYSVSCVFDVVCVSELSIIGFLYIEYTRNSIKTISKRYRKPKRKPIMDNPETHTTLNTQDTV